jgi:large subunit ribosomal protein L18
MQVQVVDDVSCRTLLGVSSRSAEIRDQLKSGGNIGAAEAVGQLLARKAGELGLKRVVFDRGGYGYHGRVKALAEKAREGGLEF